MKKKALLLCVVILAVSTISVFAEGQRDVAVKKEGKTVVGVSLPWLGTQNWAEGNEMFKTELTAAGFEPIVQQADNKVPIQQQQIEAMVRSGADIIVVAPIDGSQLGAVLENAAAAGVKVIAYDRLLENTTGIDCVVQFGSVKIGELQGQALLNGLAELKGKGPYNIELFGGGPADPNAPNFFKGAMKVLQPKIDDGTLVVVSGQTDFTQCATLDWDSSKAMSRMDTLLSGFYRNKEIDGVLSPNDAIARNIITACERAGQKIPAISGLDAENESIKWIWEGKQYSTVDKPTSVLVGKTLEIVKLMAAGKKLPAFDNNVNNGKKSVGIYELTPVIVTKANAKQVYANDPSRMAILK
jgi:putative multiple sugar transport system substrate-binding protein